MPGSIFSPDWRVLRLQRADPHMPDAQCAWLRLISDNLVRPSAYVISKAWTTSPSLTAVSPALRGLTRKRPHNPDMDYMQAACSPISLSERTRRLALYCDPVVINTKAEIAANTSPHDIVSKGGTRVALRISVPAVEPIPDCSAHGGTPTIEHPEDGSRGDWQMGTLSRHLVHPAPWSSPSAAASKLSHDMQEILEEGGRGSGETARRGHGVVIAPRRHNCTPTPMKECCVRRRRGLRCRGAAGLVACGY